jgi:hypothetical protein
MVANNCGIGYCRIVLQSFMSPRGPSPLTRLAVRPGRQGAAAGLLNPPAVPAASNGDAHHRAAR